MGDWLDVIERKDRELAAMRVLAHEALTELESCLRDGVKGDGHWQRWGDLRDRYLEIGRL